MESRISIDMDWDNQPIIRIDYKPSEDVRDKMVKRFMDTFGSESYLATFHYSNTPSDQTNSQARIRPIPITEIPDHYDNFKSLMAFTTKGEIS